MKQLGLRLVLATLVLAFVSAPAFAQATSSITGVVVDQAGGVVPGATITAKNVATGVTFTAYASAQGAFTIPAVPTGTYSVTVALDGFKTAVYNDIGVSVAGPSNIRAVLEVGAVSETVNVEAASAIVQTQSTTVSSTINTKEIQNLPLTSRSVLDFVVNLPGVNTPAGSRNSTINGLDQSSINITLDGINVQDNTLKTTDGFFAIVNPRLDAIEEVTVSGAAQTADAAGTGAVQIKFVTRGGSNTYTGSLYHYFRHDTLNENSWFNIRNGVDKPTLLQNQPGGRLGGPIVIPGLFDGHNRAFFFVNYEEFRQPRQITRNRTILSPEAQAGIFRYLVAGETRSVDLYGLAAANGLPTTSDPTIVKLLADIRAATGTTGAITELTDPNLDRYSFNVDQRSLNRFPTFRVDVNLSERHRLSSSLNYQKYLSVPDTLNSRDASFPGFPIEATQGSTRLGFSNSLRSTMGANIVNELRVGGSGAPVQFFDEINPGMWSGSLANQGGFNLGISTARITNAGPSGNKQSRNAYTWLIEDTVNWQAGSHGLNLGGSYTEVLVWLKNQNVVPSISFDQLTGTLGDTVFGRSSNFPGGSSTNRGDAEDLYSVLVGSVSNINGEGVIDGSTGEYVYMGQSLQEGKVRDFAFWAQDAWRPRPDLTINLGLRYEFQLPFQASNDSYSSTTIEDIWGISGYREGCDLSAVTAETCNIFKPGLTEGKAESQYYPFSAGTDLFNMDWDNLAPSVGLAWTPSSEGSGFLARFLGQPGDTVFRAGFSRAFQRNGMNDFTGRIDNNPGLIIQDPDRNENRSNLLAPGTDWILFREGAGALGPAPFPLTRDYPMTDIDTEDVGWFDPNIQIPYADTWSAGWQRAISRNMAVELRYVGTRSRDLWSSYDYNELNVIENGILDEFRLAQQNLQANLAAGRGGNFRYFGPGTGTNPLPITLAYFSGRTDAGTVGAYTSSNFASSDYLNALDRLDPDVFDYADELQSTATQRARALAAGLPVNFMVVNPNKLGGADITGNGGFTNYNSMQVELRRRMAQGFQFQGSYVFGRAYNSAFYSFRVPRVKQLDGGGEGGVSHAFKGSWVWELPFGQGRRFAGNVGRAMDILVGGWQVHGIFRFQSGQIINFGDVRMVGFDINDLKDMYKARLDADQNVFFLPDDVIDNTIKAFATDPTSPTGYSADGPPEGRYFAPAGGPDCIETVAGGYGTCGERDIFMDSPWIKNMDISVVKAVPIAGRVRAEFRVEMLNAFNWINYSPATGVGSSTRDGFETNSLTGLTQSRIIQLVSRVSW
jgi:hypothetical protein